MALVRVVLVDLPPLLAEVVAELIRDLDVDLRLVSGETEMRRAVASGGDCVVIVPAADGDLSEAGRILLEDRSELRVLAIAGDARLGVLSRLTVESVVIDELSQASLIGAITGIIAASDHPTGATGAGPTGHGAPPGEAKVRCHPR